MTTTPDYLPGVRLDAAVREDAFDLMARLVEHYRSTTTDLAASQWREPVSNYSDPGLFAAEVEGIHRSVPLPLAMSCELPEPGSYKATEVVGTPVLLTRDAAGQVHASVNSCRHRGAELVPEGSGKARRFVCPYHAWTYNHAGCLLGVTAESTFGEVDKASNSLLQLPVAERAGIVFVSLDRDATIDLDTWLGDELVALLESLDLANCVKHSTNYLDGPNWKVVIDGYLEGYHFASLHTTTVFRTNFSNMAAFDAYGPHMRNSFALRPIAGAVDLPRDEWDPPTCVGAIYWVFPGLAIAGGWRKQVAVSLVLPGKTWDTSRTEQVLLLRHAPLDDEELKDADHTAGWFRDVTFEEDYLTGFGVQRGLAAMGDQEFCFGRNEPGVQHFHRGVAEQLARSRP